MFTGKLKTLALAVKSPQIRFIKLANRGYYNHLSDEEYIKRMFRARMGYDLNLESPRTFNEKLQWLKIHDHNPLYTTLVDKYAVKEYVGNIIGTEHIIPTFGVWDRFEDIDFSALPDQFVLKCTHDSGGLVIVKDKKVLDMNAAQKKINRSLANNYFYVGREWPYLNVKHRIIAEKYITDPLGNELSDYKVLCFHGEPKLIEYHQGRYTDQHYQDFYDTEWNLTTIAQSDPPNHKDISQAVPPPKTLNQMLELSKVLSRDMAHIRVDWYSIRDTLYFGELTFYDGNGFEPFVELEDDLKLGSWITLP